MSGRSRPARTGGHERGPLRSARAAVRLVVARTAVLILDPGGAGRRMRFPGHARDEHPQRVEVRAAHRGRFSTSVPRPKRTGGRGRVGPAPLSGPRMRVSATATPACAGRRRLHSSSSDSACCAAAGARLGLR
jgi:hypothetical protein